jgi:hypothetical protein
MFTIERLGQNSGAGSFSYATGSTEQERVGDVAGFKRIFQGLGHMTLPYDLIKAHGSILSGGNDILFRHAVNLEFRF